MEEETLAAAGQVPRIVLGAEGLVVRLVPKQGMRMGKEERSTKPRPCHTITYRDLRWEAQVGQWTLGQVVLFWSLLPTLSISIKSTTSTRSCSRRTFN